jgi:hypothetical protein
MPSHARRPRAQRRVRQLRPCLFALEERVVPSVPGATGIALDASGNVFVSYNSTSAGSTQQESIGEFNSNGFLISSSVIGTPGASAIPGALTTVGSSASLPNTISTDILELQPNGQLFLFNPGSGTSSQYDALPNDSLSASSVFDVQTGSVVDLSSQISLKGATYGDFGISQNSLLVSGESNNWDFVARFTYGSSGTTATVLVASPVSGGLSATPGGLAIDSQGMVLTTLPYQPAGSSAIHSAVGFSASFNAATSPAPVVPKLGLTNVPNIASNGITVDPQDNFILAVKDSSLYGGGPGIVHINSALTAFLADPTTSSQGTPTGIALADVGGTNRLAFTGTFSNAGSDTFITAGELSLFSGQVTPAQLRHAYGIDQIHFTNSSGATVTGDGSGQTIAIVEEGVDPTLAADLTTFDQYFGIAAPPSFQVVDQNGVTTQNTDIVGEASLDVEWAHAIAPGASIVVYNSAYYPNDPTTSFENLIKAMNQASQLPGVSVVTLSYGESENSVAASGLNQQTLDANFQTPGVTFLAASGDSGAYGDGGFQAVADYPAASPNIVSVGGTSIVIDSAGNYPGTSPSGELAWGSGTSSGVNGGGGGGLSSVEPQPSWQSAAVSATYGSVSGRALPDVSIDSGSAQEYDVFTSTLSGSSVSASAVGWLGDAGTSAASPIWAGLIAIANQGRVLAGGTPLTGNTQTLPALYSLPSSDFHDILYGSNGYSAGPGYDLATGLGTPVANLLVPDLANYQLSAKTGNATKISVQTSPLAPAFGQPLTLTATVSVVSPATGTPTGSVTFQEGSTVLGTKVLTNGVATITFNPTEAGSQTFTIAYRGDSTDQPSSTTFSLTVSPAAATLGLSGLSFTYDGSPHAATVSTNPAGLSGVSVTYTQNGAAVGTPTQAGTYAVTATLDNPDYTAQPVTGTLVIDQATATLSLDNLSLTYDGSAQAPTVTTRPSGLSGVTLTYSQNGVAVTNPTNVGNYAVTATLNNPNYTAQPVTGTLVISHANATLSLSNLNLTYNGTAQAAVVITSPAGIPGVNVTYTQNGVTVPTPIHPGVYTVTTTLDNPNASAQPVTGTLVIGQAIPTLIWTAPANITVGTPLGSSQLDAAASFNGSPLSGAFTYLPQAGTVLPAGTGQILSVSFTPTDTTDFLSATSSVPINVVTTPPLAMVIHEQPNFQRTLKNGKPVGNYLLTGFTLVFNMPLKSGPATNIGNYQLETLVAVKVKNKITHVLQPIKTFTVKYAPGTHSVTIKLIGGYKFALGGKLTVLKGVSNRSGHNLGGTTVFTITPGGKTIVPA